MRRTLTTRRLGRLLATIAAAAACATVTGCGLSDPMTTTSKTTTDAAAAAPATSSSTTPPTSSDDARAAAQRFADAYVALLNDGGAPAERQLRAAAAPKLADGLILASQDAQLAGDASASSSTRLVALAQAAGAHWRATFATGRTRWAMLLDVSSSAHGTIVAAAVTQPAT